MSSGHNEISSQKAWYIELSKAPSSWFKRVQLTQSPSFSTQDITHSSIPMIMLRPQPLPERFTSWADCASERQLANLRSHLDGQKKWDHQDTKV